MHLRLKEEKNLSLPLPKKMTIPWPLLVKKSNLSVRNSTAQAVLRSNTDRFDNVSVIDPHIIVGASAGGNSSS